MNQPIEIPNSVTGPKLQRLLSNFEGLKRAKLPPEHLLANWVVPVLGGMVEIIATLDGALAQAQLQAQAALQMAAATANGDALESLFDLLTELQNTLDARLPPNDPARDLITAMFEVYRNIDTEGVYFGDEEEATEAAPTSIPAPASAAPVPTPALAAPEAAPQI